MKCRHGCGTEIKDGYYCKGCLEDMQDEIIGKWYPPDKCPDCGESLTDKGVCLSCLVCKDGEPVKHYHEDRGER